MHMHLTHAVYMPHPDTYLKKRSVFFNVDAEVKGSECYRISVILPCVRHLVRSTNETEPEEASFL